MIRLLIFNLIMIALIVLCIPLIASGADPEAADPGALITQIFGYFKGGQWILGVMAIIMLLTHVINKISFIAKWIPNNAKPWVSAGLGVLLAVFTALATGIPWWQALIAGLFTGAAASGLWSLVGKHVLNTADDKEKKAELKVVKSALKEGKLEVDKKTLELKIPDWAKDKPGGG